MSYSSVSTTMTWVVTLSNRGGNSRDKTPTFSSSCQEFRKCINTMGIKTLKKGDEVTLTIKIGRKHVNVDFYVNRENATTLKAKSWPSSLSMPNNGQKAQFRVIFTSMKPVEEVKPSATSVVKKSEAKKISIDDVISQTMEEFKVTLTDRLKKIQA